MPAAVWIVLLIAVLAVFATAAIVIALRRQEEVPPPVPNVEGPDDEAVRMARQRALEERGEELLERRADLDARRGTLQGNSAVDEELDRLWERLRTGEIGEEEFEAEKIRLLGG